MAKYKIPEEYLSGFKEISILTREIATEIGTCLSGLQIGDCPADFENNIKSNSRLSSINAQSVSSTIFSLIGLASDEKESLDQLISDLVDAYSIQEKGVSQQEITTLKDNLGVILKSADKVNLTRKAIGLLSEYEKIFLDCRVVTDIRLIFPEKVDAAQQAVVVHNLKIEYQQNEEVKKNYFALDTNDLKMLKEHIDRALEKEKIIREKIKLQNINYLEL